MESVQYIDAFSRRKTTALARCPWPLHVLAESDLSWRLTQLVGSGSAVGHVRVIIAAVAHPVAVGAIALEPMEDLNAVAEVAIGVRVEGLVQAPP